ncbi:hypothetical protein PoB_007328300 [Plakobranchus ocellatus]|uniref:Uncharacterized protein n=1 Tax=Plakobranchus ocellatus TaxID=259542 RepID=A0AAV4DRS6_9GAST|nr:hypothetical protein PoB_007328300 [Plakobranchus ocellatus]
MYNSSNMREIAVLLCLQSFKPALWGKRVQILTDVFCAANVNFQGGNWNASGSVQCGNANLERCVKEQFNHFRQMVGRKTEHNARLFKSFRQQIQLENSRNSVSDPTTSGVDAFSQTDWRKENNFINAPFRLIPGVLNKLDQYQALATIIAPMSRAHPFFLKLKNRSIAPPKRPPKAQDFCLPLSNTLPEPLRNPKWKFYAWRVCGRRHCCPADGH